MRHGEYETMSSGRQDAQVEASTLCVWLLSPCVVIVKAKRIVNYIKLLDFCRKELSDRCLKPELLGLIISQLVPHILSPAMRRGFHPSDFHCAWTTVNRVNMVREQKWRYHKVHATYYHTIYMLFWLWPFNQTNPFIGSFFIIVPSSSGCLTLSQVHVWSHLTAAKWRNLTSQSPPKSINSIYSILTFDLTLNQFLHSFNSF